MPVRHASFAADIERPEGGEAGPLPQRWSILLPLPLDGAYDYTAPAGIGLAPGTFVTVPLGRRTVPGVVWAAGDEGGIAAERLKPIAGVLDAPPLGESLRRFIDWVAAYTMTPPGAVLRMAMSVPEALAPPRSVVAYAITESGA